MGMGGEVPLRDPTTGQLFFGRLTVEIRSSPFYVDPPSEKDQIGKSIGESQLPLTDSLVRESQKIAELRGSLTNEFSDVFAGSFPSEYVFEEENLSNLGERMGRLRELGFEPMLPKSFESLQCDIHWEGAPSGGRKTNHSMPIGEFVPRMKESYGGVRFFLTNYDSAHRISVVDQEGKMHPTPYYIDSSDFFRRRRR